MGRKVPASVLIKATASAHGGNEGEESHCLSLTGTGSDVVGASRGLISQCRGTG